MSDPMQAEWQAWQNVVREWPGDINDRRFDRVVKATQLWSEHLASLRRDQPSGLREKAQENARTAYETAKAETP